MPRAVLLSKSAWCRWLMAWVARLMCACCGACDQTPTLFVIGVLIVLAAGLVWRRSEDVWSGAWLPAGTGLLLSPVAYPWYFLWIVPGRAYRPPTGRQPRFSVG